MNSCQMMWFEVSCPSNSVDMFMISCFCGDKREFCLVVKAMCAYGCPSFSITRT